VSADLVIIIFLSLNLRGSRNLDDRVPLLYPFFRHTITSVRLAVVKTIQIFISLSTSDKTWLDDRLFRLLFQNMIVEEKDDIRQASAEAWSTAVDTVATDRNLLRATASSHLAGWFAIAGTPIGSPIPVSLFWRPNSSTIANGFAYDVDKSLIAQDLSLISVERIMKGRVEAAKALALLLARWPDEVSHS
jgi:TATA-binding protein-associated factor